MYQEVKPSAKTNKLIDTFWTYSKNNANEYFKVLPDTCVDWIFDLSQNKSFLSGVMTNYQCRELSAESDLIGVRFKVEKFALLSKVPLSESKNLRVELADVLPAKKRSSLNQLTDLHKKAQITLLEKFIEQSWKHNAQTQDQMVLAIVQHIRALRGIVNVTDLAKSQGISLRQLERRFKSCIGLTVKEFSKIVRFNHAKQSIGAFTKTSLLQIAFASGFFDHAHMAAEFKRISGENPSFFR